MKSVTKINKPKNNADVGEKIKYIRCNSLMTQGDLATKIGRKREEITMFENGTRTIDIHTLKDIAELFNVSTDYLLGISDFENADIDNIAINRLTGLSDEAIKNLININKYHSSTILSTINYLLEQEKLFPDEYYNMISSDEMTDKDKEKLSKTFEEWKKNNYIKLFTNISNYFNAKIDTEETIRITSNSVKKENDITDLYELATTKEIISNKDIANTFLLKQIEKLLEKAKDEYLNNNNRNE